MDKILKSKIDIILEEMKMVYLNDNRPWIIGYSGGKDSTTVVQLVYTMLLNLPKEQRKKSVYVISSDTLIENPLILGFLEENSKIIGYAAKESNLPLYTQIIYPEFNNTFWVNVIGKGMPTPTSIRFRWCTERLKIKPTNKFIEEKVKENGKVVVLLGVRKAESSIRKTRIENREIDGYLLTPHTTLNNTYVYNPIVELSTDEVWAYLLDNDGLTPWNTDNKVLFSLYLGADSGECPFTITADSTGNISTPSCGNSRFGCWICTVVSKDRSLSGFIDNGEEYLKPLLDYREWILDIRDKYEYRLTYRRDGNHYYKKFYLDTLPLLDNYKLDEQHIFVDDFDNRYIDLKNSHMDYDSDNYRISTDKDKIALDLLPLDGDCIDMSKIHEDNDGKYINILGFGPFNFKARQLILIKLLEIQKQYNIDGFDFKLIKEEELLEIDKVWDKEEDLTCRTLVDIYYDIMETRLPWDKYKKPIYDKDTLGEIENLCDKYNIRHDLVNKLLIETNSSKYYSNKSKLTNSISKILSQKHWHQFLTEEIEDDN